MRELKVLIPSVKEALQIKTSYSHSMFKSTNDPIELIIDRDTAEQLWMALNHALDIPNKLKDDHVL